MKFGFIYCLGNCAMPGIYKIGMTERAPSQRCLELSSSTSAPLPFDLLFYGEVENPQAVEREIHEIFAARRVSLGREFFQGYTSEFHASLAEWCDSICVTTVGRYYLTDEGVIEELASAETDERRVELFLQLAKREGVAIWNDQGHIRFSRPSLGQIPRWILQVVATSKTVLLQHLPAGLNDESALMLAISSSETPA